MTTTITSQQFKSVKPILDGFVFYQELKNGNVRVKTSDKNAIQIIENLK